MRAQIYGTGYNGTGGLRSNNVSTKNAGASTYSMFNQKKKRPSTAGSKKSGTSVNKKKKTLKKKIVNGNLVNNQGVLLNNYFPALEHPQNFGLMEGGTS